MLALEDRLEYRLASCRYAVNPAENWGGGMLTAFMVPGCFTPVFVIVVVVAATAG